MAADRVRALVAARRRRAPSLGAATWLWTTVEAITRRRVLVVDFDQTANPWMRLWRLVLPDGGTSTAVDSVLTVVWTVVVVALVVAGLARADRRRRAACRQPTPSVRCA